MLNSKLQELADLSSWDSETVDQNKIATHLDAAKEFQSQYYERLYKEITAANPSDSKPVVHSTQTSSAEDFNNFIKLHAAKFMDLTRGELKFLGQELSPTSLIYDHILAGKLITSISCGKPLNLNAEEVVRIAGLDIDRYEDSTDPKLFSRIKSTLTTAADELVKIDDAQLWNNFNSMGIFDSLIPNDQAATSSEQ